MWRQLQYGRSFSVCQTGPSCRFVPNRSNRTLVSRRLSACRRPDPTSRDPGSLRPGSRAHLVRRAPYAGCPTGPQPCPIGWSGLRETGRPPLEPQDCARTGSLGIRARPDGGVAVDADPPLESPVRPQKARPLPNTSGRHGGVAAGRDGRDSGCPCRAVRVWQDCRRHAGGHRPAALESGWTLTFDGREGRDGAHLSATGVDTSGWLPATVPVPGTVLASLVEQGRLPDPVVGLNNLRVPERSPATPGGTGGSSPCRRTCAWGRAAGCGWSSTASTTRRTSGSTASAWAGRLTYPFARSAHDVTALVADRDDHALVVRNTPMPVPGSPGDKGPAGESWVDAGAGQMNLNSPTYLAVSGCDWMPAVRDRAAGIWNHVRLRSTGDIVIGDPPVDTVLPRLPDTSVAELTFTVPVRNVGATGHRATVSVALDERRSEHRPGVGRKHVHRGLRGRAARPAPAAPHSEGPGRRHSVPQHLLAPPHTRRHAAVEHAQAGRTVRDDHPSLTAGQPPRTDRHRRQPGSGRRRDGTAVPAGRQRQPRTADAVRRQPFLAAARRVADLALSWPGEALPSGRPVLHAEAFNSRAVWARS